MQESNTPEFFDPAIRFTGKKASECPNCNGYGYTQDTSTEVVQVVEGGKWSTRFLGSGCPVCHGTGQRV